MTEYVTVETPQGPVKFPKGMSRADMAAALNKLQSPTPEQPKGLVQTIKENLLGDDDPNTQNLGEKVGSALNKAGESLTFGLIGDETSAAAESLLPGVNYEDRLKHYRDQEAVLERDNPKTALAADIGGAVAGIATPLGTIGTLGKGAGMMARIGASAAAGAGMGGTYGFMEGEGLDDRIAQAETGAKIGGAVGGAAPVVAGGVQKIADALARRSAMRAAAKGAESTAQTRAASGAAYDAFENSGVEISPDAMNRLRTALTDRLSREGLDTLPGQGSLTPGGQRIVNAVSGMDDEVAAAAAAGQNPAVPLGSIENLRRQAGNVAQGVNPLGRATADARLGSIAIEEIDNFVNGLQAADVPIGDVNVARNALSKARELWARASKTQLLDNVVDAQDNYLGGSASAIRNKTASLLRNPKTARQFSEAEKAMLQKIIGGNGLTRAIRLMGNGIGRQIQMAGGAGLGGVPGALAGLLTGELTGAMADRNAVRGAEIVRAIIANGGMKTLPNASPAIGRITEALVRRGGAAVPQ